MVKRFFKTGSKKFPIPSCQWCLTSWKDTTYLIYPNPAQFTSSLDKAQSCFTCLYLLPHPSKRPAYHGILLCGIPLYSLIQIPQIQYISTRKRIVQDMPNSVTKGNIVTSDGRVDIPSDWVGYGPSFCVRVGSTRNIALLGTMAGNLDKKASLGNWRKAKQRHKPFTTCELRSAADAEVPARSVQSAAQAQDDRHLTAAA